MIIWLFLEAHWPSVLIIISVVMIIAWLFWPDHERESHARQRAEEEGRTTFGGILNTSETPTYTALSGTAGAPATLILDSMRRLWSSVSDHATPTNSMEDVVEVFDEQGSWRIPVSQVRFYVQGREEGQYIPILREHVERILHPMLRGNGWGGSGGTSGVTNVRGTYTTQTSPYIGGDSFDNSYWGRVLVDLESYTHPSEGGLENPIVHEESPSNPLPAIPAPRVNAYNRLLNTDGLPIEAPRIDGQLIYNAPHRHGIIGGTSDVDRAFEAFELSVNSTFDGPRAQMGLPPIDDQPTIMTTDGRHREDDDEFSMEAWLKDGQELLTGEPPIDKPNPA